MVAIRIGEDIQAPGELTEYHLIVHPIVHIFYDTYLYLIAIALEFGLSFFFFVLVGMSCIMVIFTFWYEK